MECRACIEELFVPLVLYPGIDEETICGISFFNLVRERSVRKLFRMIQTVEVGHVRDRAAELPAGGGWASGACDAQGIHRFRREASGLTFVSMEGMESIRSIPSLKRSNRGLCIQSMKWGMKTEKLTERRNAMIRKWILTALLCITAAALIFGCGKDYGKVDQGRVIEFGQG